VIEDNQAKNDDESVELEKQQQLKRLKGKQVVKTGQESKAAKGQASQEKTG
jgi:hypothetical protein